MRTLLLFLLGCGPTVTSSDDEQIPTVQNKAKSPMSAFKLTGYTETTDGMTRVVLNLRTPGGDMAVQKAKLEDVVATVGGASVEVSDVTIKPLMTGCKVIFVLPGKGEVRLTGVVALQNADGSIWATVPLPETLKAK